MKTEDHYIEYSNIWPLSSLEMVLGNHSGLLCGTRRIDGSLCSNAGCFESFPEIYKGKESNDELSARQNYQYHRPPGHALLGDEIRFFAPLAALFASFACCFFFASYSYPFVEHGLKGRSVKEYAGLLAFGFLTFGLFGLWAGLTWYVAGY